jgi:hypothetical protein
MRPARAVGHKHSQRIRQEKNYVRYEAGAVNPDRYEAGWSTMSLAKAISPAARASAESDPSQNMDRAHCRQSVPPRKAGSNTIPARRSDRARRPSRCVMRGAWLSCPAPVALHKDDKPVAFGTGIAFYFAAVAMTRRLSSGNARCSRFEILRMPPL